MEVRADATISAGAVGKAQAHWPAHEELEATQPGPLFRLQQDLALPEPQQDIPPARSGWRGTTVAQNAASANTATAMRPLTVRPSYQNLTGEGALEERYLQFELGVDHLIVHRVLQREAELLADPHDVPVVGQDIRGQLRQFLVGADEQQAGEQLLAE